MTHYPFPPIVKTLLRWGIVGAALFFLGKVLKEHWQGVTAIRLNGLGWACLAISLGVTLLAHICAGWVWGRILQQDFRQPVQSTHLIQAYLQTNIAKYLPGNIWHYYGRISAATQAGASLETATVSTLLEPLLMVAAALIVALFSHQAIAHRQGILSLLGHCLALVGVLAALHPKILNPLMQRVKKIKQKVPMAIGKPNGQTALAPTALAQPTFTQSVLTEPALIQAALAPETPLPMSLPQQDQDVNRLVHYPWRALLGELGFLLLRGGGFLMTFFAIWQFDRTAVPMLLGVFSLAWVLGLVMPGAPGGVGVFEATAIALLGGDFSASLLLGIVALYRLISVAAEALGAGLGWLDARWH